MRAKFPGTIHLKKRKRGWAIFRVPMSSKSFISYYSKILDLQYNSTWRSPVRFLALSPWLKFPQLYIVPYLPPFILTQLSFLCLSASRLCMFCLWIWLVLFWLVFKILLYYSSYHKCSKTFLGFLYSSFHLMTFLTKVLLH